MDHWHLKQDYVDQVVEWAFKLLEQYNKGERIIGLGQSPAPTLMAAAMVSRMRGQTGRIQLVPFTGTSHQRVGRNDPAVRAAVEADGVMRYEAPEEWQPSEELLQRYKTFLFKLGCSGPQWAADLKEGNKVVLTDMIREANGLASFLTFLCLGEDPKVIEILREQMTLHAFDLREVNNHDRLEDGLKGIWRVARQPLSAPEGEIMSGSAAENCARSGSGRVVPMWRLNAAHGRSTGLVPIPNDPMREQILAVLHENVQRVQQALDRAHRKNMKRWDANYKDVFGSAEPAALETNLA